MRRVLSRSNWRKATVLVIAIVGLLLLFEIEMFDSQYSVWQSMVRQDGPPPAGSRLNFDATAYCKGVTTASGVNVRTGIAAADPIILPVGSVLNVAAGDPRYSGVYTVMDTGPRVQGRQLDLYMWNCNEALRFGRKAIEVTVLRLGWDPQASSPGLINRLFRGREARRIPAPQPPPPGGVPPLEGVLPDDAATTTSPAPVAPVAPAEGIDER